MLNIHHDCALLIYLLIFEGVRAQNADIPRWGQATALVGSTLFVQGGRTDPYSQFSYTTATVNNDLLSLSLSSPFSLSSTPWQYLSGCSNCSTDQGPAVAWHTITPFSTTNLLLFGGDPGPNSPVVLPAVPDSAVLLNIAGTNATWDYETRSWANEPMRRIYHTASSSNGRVYIVGGQKADGSGIAFSDHYVFDPTGPSFTPLPGSNAPPDITGHQAVLLPDGRLLVFGGYSPSEKSLIPLTTVWSLDTTDPNTSWTFLSVSTLSVPPPRRGFAAALIDDGKIIIQGGADAVMQTSFDDGWVLDTTQNPMTWSSISALAQLGPRRDHFAVGIGSLVIFGFGYALNGGASAGLQIFDASSGTFVTSYTPPSAIASPTTTTLPVPSQTGSGSNPQGPGTSSYGSAEIPYPTGWGTGQGGGDGGNNPPGGGNGTGTPLPNGGSASGHNAIVIALSTVFSVLALLAGSIAATWYIRRRRSQDNFEHLIDNFSDDGEEVHAIPVASMREKNHTTVPSGLRNMKERLSGFIPGHSTQHQHAERIDMLADEDTEPGWYAIRRDPSSGRSSWTSRRSWRTPTLDRVYDSLRSAGGAALGYVTGAAAAGARSLKSREGSASSQSQIIWRSEKDTGPFDPYSDNVGLVSYGPPSFTATRPRGGRQASSYSYHDPFEDYDVESLNFDPDVVYRDDPESKGEIPSLNDPPPRPNLQLRTLGPRATTDLTRLTPVSEQPSVPTLSDPISSSEASLSRDGIPNPFAGSGTSLSHSSYDPPQSPRRPSSIIDSNASSSQFVRRSDSWWSRFAKAPLLDRRFSSRSSEPRPPLDFKDPNPPPRLMPIEESTHSNSPDSPEKRQRSGSSGHNRIYSTLQHGRSASSLQTSRTANSENLERLAQTMQIVQKGSTMSSHSSGPSASTRDESPERVQASGEPALSIIMSNDSQSTDPSAEALVQSPAEMTVEESSRNLSGIATELASPKRPPQSPGPRGSPSSVAAKVQAYERRMSQMEDAPISLRSPPPVPNRSRRAAPAYGLAPKSPLFVANPDHKRSSDSS